MQALRVWAVEWLLLSSRILGDTAAPSLGMVVSNPHSRLCTATVRLPFTLLANCIVVHWLSAAAFDHAEAFSMLGGGVVGAFKQGNVAQ
jgi:hypothetical protein